MNWKNCFRALPVLAMMACCFTNQASAQTNPGFPYNPDANGNETIESNDLISFLSFFGAPFLPSGVLPIEGGGTGSARWTVRDSCLESALLDITPLGQTGPRGESVWIAEHHPNLGPRVWHGRQRILLPGAGSQHHSLGTVQLCVQPKQHRHSCVLQCHR